VITALLGEWIDTGVILAVVLVNAMIGFIQEGKAEQALEGIRRMLSLEATVIRDGRRQQIPAEELVPGDVVLLESGDRVPADLRLLAVRNARVEEAALTGESVPVTKTLEPCPERAARRSEEPRVLRHAGHRRSAARPRGRDGRAPEIGRIGEMVSGVEKMTTPLLEKIDRFGKQLSAAILGFAVLSSSSAGSSAATRWRRSS
jgi:P-type Ca2+ transporter type 2C